MKVFILNNEYMGMVRQWQELLHGGRYSESYSQALPDFVKLAEAYRGKGIRCSDRTSSMMPSWKCWTIRSCPVRLPCCQGRELLPHDSLGQGP